MPAVVAAVDRPAPAPPQPAPEYPLVAEAAAAGRSLHRALKAVAGVGGFVSTIIGLVFVLAPDLKPTGAAPVQSARLSELRVDDDATFGQYLARIDQPRTGYSGAQLGRRGALLDFRVRIEGFKGRTLLLKWELFDAAGKQRNESKAIRIRPTNATNEATWQFWIPLPHDRGRYTAVVELVEQKKSYLLDLASAETGTLTGLAARNGKS